jgi:hypothetical protein
MGAPWRKKTQGKNVRRENGIEPQQFELKDVENEEAAGGEDF